MVQQMDIACSTHKEYQKCMQSLSGNLKWRQNLCDFGVDVKKILKWILEKLNIMAWSRLKWVISGWKDSNEIMDFVKAGMEYPDCIYNKVLAPNG